MRWPRFALQRRPRHESAPAPGERVSVRGSIGAKLTLVSLQGARDVIPEAAAAAAATSVESERRACALSLDGELRRVCREEAAVRRLVGSVAGAFLRQRAHDRLGFARVGDYTRERLGISRRALESYARVAAQLAVLPATAAAFERGELSWTHARLLCAVATPESEREWLEAARTRSARALAARIKTRAEADDPEVRAAIAECAEDGALIDEEPAVRLRIACPGRVRSLWRRAVELARRMCAAQVPPWQAAEAIAAEALAGCSRAKDCGDFDRELARLDARRRAPGRDDEPMRDDGPMRREVPTADVPTTDARAPSNDCASDEVLAGDLATLARGLESADAFVLSERLETLMQAIRTIDARVSRLLDPLMRLRMHRLLGYPSASEYVRDRLGLSP